MSYSKSIPMYVSLLSLPTSSKVDERGIQPLFIKIWLFSLSLYDVIRWYPLDPII